MMVATSRPYRLGAGHRHNPATAAGEHNAGAPAHALPAAADPARPWRRPPPLPPEAADAGRPPARPPRRRRPRPAACHTRLGWLAALPRRAHSKSRQAHRPGRHRAPTPPRPDPTVSPAPPTSNAASPVTPAAPNAAPPSPASTVSNGAGPPPPRGRRLRRYRPLDHRAVKPDTELRTRDLRRARPPAIRSCRASRSADCGSLRHHRHHTPSRACTTPPPSKSRPRRPPRWTARRQPVGPWTPTC